MRENLEKNTKHTTLWSLAFKCYKMFNDMQWNFWTERKYVDPLYTFGFVLFSSPLPWGKFTFSPVFSMLLYFVYIARCDIFFYFSFLFSAASILAPSMRTNIEHMCVYRSDCALMFCMFFFLLIHMPSQEEILKKKEEEICTKLI